MNDQKAKRREWPPGKRCFKHIELIQARLNVLEPRPWQLNYKWRHSMFLTGLNFISLHFYLSCFEMFGASESDPGRRVENSQSQKLPVSFCFLPLIYNTIRALCSNLRTKTFFSFPAARKDNRKCRRVGRLGLVLHANNVPNWNATLKPIRWTRNLYLALRPNNNTPIRQLFVIHKIII